MHFLRIVLMCVTAAVVYGILHDQVTARVCVEYFTIGHPPIFATDDPTLLAVGWGILATWWAGLLLGVPLALIARAGSRPKRTASSLVRPVVTLSVVMAVGAVAAGGIGWVLSRAGLIILLEPLASAVPPDRHDVYLADLWAHSASYLIAFAGGVVVMVRVWRSRAI
jgi:hypothetical protein